MLLSDHGARERSLRLYQLLENVWKSLPAEKNMKSCLASMGSLARMETAPFSDRDLIILYVEEDAADPDDNADKKNVHVKSRSSEREKYMDHVLRTIQQCDERVSIIARSLTVCAGIFDTDFRSWLSLLESRFLAGDRSVFEHLRDELKRSIMREGKNIVSMLKIQAERRHRQYGVSVTLLEPNIKNSAGALRDIQAIYYIELLERYMSRNEDEGATPFFDDIIDDSSHVFHKKALKNARYFNLSVREAMHEASGHLHDYLDYGLQRTVAEKMGYGKASDKQSVEHFMQDYYRNARLVHKSLTMAFEDFLEKIEYRRESKKRKEAVSPEEVHEAIAVCKYFEMPDYPFLTQKAGVLHLSDTSQKMSGTNVLTIFRLVCDNGYFIGSDIVRRIDSAGDISYESRKALLTFDAILRSDGNVGTTLRRMNEHGVLGKLLPEFGELELFFQHNVYHYYTADEHTITAIERCEALESEDNLFGEVFRSIGDKSVLFYSILFHDITKPVNIKNHEITGSQLAPILLQRFNREEIANDVAFLVRRHLSMEQLAFRRNFREAATLDCFAEMLSSRHRLDLLFILTYSDMAALNPNVLTDWKKELLTELYLETKKRMEKRSLEEKRPGAEKMTEEKEKAVEEGIERCMNAVRSGKKVCFHVKHGKAFSEVTVVCKDAANVLSNIAAVLMGADAVIVDAAVRTLEDAVVRDTFRVIDFVKKGRISDQQVETIDRLLEDVWNKRMEAEDIFLRHRIKWKRKLKTSQSNRTPTEVDYSTHIDLHGREQTNIDVFSPDTLGLLYKLSKTISSFDMDIKFAKIATKVDGVIDSFYVTDSKGGALKDIEKKEKLRSALIEIIRTLTSHAERTQRNNR